MKKIVAAYSLQPAAVAYNIASHPSFQLASWSVVCRRRAAQQAAAIWQPAGRRD